MVVTCAVAIGSLIASAVLVGVSMMAGRSVLMPNFSTLKERLGSSLWFIPSVMVLGAIALSLVTTTLDDATEGRPFTELIFTGGPDSARGILQTVAGAVITLTALVFTITIVALQLSSQQFSPRVLRTFLRDTQSKLTLGIFISTFIYCLMVLRVIGTADDRGVTIPSISMMALLVLVVASVAMFVSYISHMAHSIRVSQIVAAVGAETRDLIESLDDSVSDPKGDLSLVGRPVGDVVKVRDIGSLTALDHRGLVELAASSGVALVMKVGVGDFLVYEQELVEVRGSGEIDHDAVHELTTVSLERTMQQDVAFGIRQLVDVAEKALSPSMNDPTTAVMALDQIHDLMRRLVDRSFPPTIHLDRAGIVRLVSKEWDWEALVTLAFTEIRQFAGSSLQVTRRMMAVLHDLTHIAPPERQRCLEREARQLEAAVRRSFDQEHDRDVAAKPDPQGIGPVADGSR